MKEEHSWNGINRMQKMLALGSWPLAKPKPKAFKPQRTQRQTIINVERSRPRLRGESSQAEKGLSNNNAQDDESSLREPLCPSWLRLSLTSREFQGMQLMKNIISIFLLIAVSITFAVAQKPTISNA